MKATIMRNTNYIWLQIYRTSLKNYSADADWYAFLWKQEAK